MQLNGLLHGARLLAHVDFPTSEVLGPDASEDAIQALIDRHGLIFVKPVFRGGVGKKGKAGLVGKARTLKEALAGTDTEAIKSATEKLVTSSQTFAQKLYDQASAQQGGGAEPFDVGQQDAANDDEVIDAEIVDE